MNRQQRRAMMKALRERKAFTVRDGPYKGQVMSPEALSRALGILERECSYEQIKAMSPAQFEAFKSGLMRRAMEGSEAGESAAFRADLDAFTESATALQAVDGMEDAELEALETPAQYAAYAEEAYRENWEKETEGEEC